MKNKIIILVAIGILSILNCFAQEETPKQLGIHYFNSLKSNDTTEIVKVIPKPEVLLEFSKSVGYEQTEEEIAVFLETYPKQVNKFLGRFKQLKLDGEKLGIDWVLTKFKDVEINSSEREIKKKGETYTVALTDLNVIFEYQTKTYRLVLNSIFEHDEKWFLTGYRPRIEIF